MTMPGIEGHRLKKFMRKQTGRSLIVDCRPFLSFAASHVRGSCNANLNSVVIRRSRGGPVPLRFIIPDERARGLLKDGRVSALVLVLEQGACQPSHRAGTDTDRTAQIIMNTLTASVSPGVKIYFLKGGYENFHSQYPECCTELQPDVNYSSVQDLKEPVSSPMNLPKDTNRRPAYDQGTPVEILPFLYLGSAYHASRLDFLDDLRITALLNVSRNCAEYFKGKYLYKFIPVEDNATADISSCFQEAIDFIDNVRHAGGKVLVHCEAGISRSPTICLAYLMRNKQLQLEDAFDYIKHRRAAISPNFGFMDQLRQYESEVVSLAPSSPVKLCSTEELTYNSSLESSVYTFPSTLLDPVPVPSSVHQFEFSPIKVSLSC